LILAVDVPFVSAAFLEFLIARSMESRASVTVVRTRDGFQPLCAIYRRAFGDSAEAALREGHCKIDASFDETQIEVIGDGELLTAGFPARLFHNLNTPEDLERAGGNR
jgi:molybdopterin-guanine dinucleotide biosynthesis protein A